MAAVAQVADAMSDLCATMDDIVHIIEQETALVRAGALTEASRLQAAKTDLANRYYTGASQLKAILANPQPGHEQEIADLRRKHDEFRALLQINLTVLATAHAVSEGIMRGVSDELARKAAPSTYGASGRTNAPSPNAAQPLTLSRVL
ncbi:hypothetical protein [Pseudorhodoplanes sp.]|uniref:hypothetical protein n=1 Tax=Pseudorhodoplanes sp. TaxID=1934341 RepID=UPI002C3387F9|nr:hypothetical protein [Pseudorhodoplanes sp.]HWV51576.1 hypothetical protein [Pseudorhodoplanes sp.]